MEDFASILVRDYGLKPQGKSAPMSSTKVSPGVGSSRGSGYVSDRKGSLSGRMSGNASTFGGQEDVPYLSRKNGSTKISGRNSYGGGGGGDDIFSPGNYDDVFGGPPKSSAAGPRYDDVFGDVPDSGRAPVYDDVFAGLGVKESKGSASSPRVGSPRRSDRSNFASESAGFEELLPGFSSEPAKSRTSGDAVASHDGDPFVPPLIDDPLSTTSGNSSSAPFIDPMDVFTVPPVPPVNTNADAPHASSSASGAFDGFDIFDGYANQSVDASKPRESSLSSRDDLRKLVEDFNSSHSTGTREQSPADETEASERDLPTVEHTEAYNISSKSAPFFSFKSDDGIETAAPSVSTSKLGDDGLLSSSLDSPVPFKARSRSSPFGDLKERWLTVNDVKLVTKPCSVPPPSRPPPVPGFSRYGSRSRVDHIESSLPEDRFTSASWPSANTASAAYGHSSEEEQTGGGTPGGSRKDFFGRMDHKMNAANHSGDDEKDVEEDAAAVKAREKEKQEKERQEREAKEAEAKEERERERARKYREKEREREKDRAAVQRVTLEARERAAQEARDRAQRTAVERATTEARERAAQQAQERAARERAAVEKANAEARDRAEHRAAIDKATKERAEQRAAVDRAAAEARERAERAAVERAQTEVRERAERAAVERAGQEARQRAERAAADRAGQEARQRAAAEARERAERERAEKENSEKTSRERREQEHRKSEHDLDSFFNPGLHATPPSSEPKRSASVNNMSSVNFDSNPVRRSTNNSRPASVPSGDYLRSLLEDPVPQPTSNTGEDPAWNKRSGASDRSQERVKQALENIRKREAEMQREQAEKHRAADQLDAEIKRWAAGKEGNLRALLSTLQYVLWPECGWQPVSLSDLITGAAVKKTYRKATLYVHPDKVQQKGATVQQKYIAEKVFDLLKEAWNKFNSEELF